jgi:cytochrome c oxidase subunit 2
LNAQQFNWKARVAGDDNVLGKANVRYIEGANTFGVDLLILMHKMILLLQNYIFQREKNSFKMRSQDVLHSAYMPYFRANELCSGMVTEFAFEPIYTR